MSLLHTGCRYLCVEVNQMSRTILFVRPSHVAPPEHDDVTFEP